MHTEAERSDDWPAFRQVAGGDREKEDAMLVRDKTKEGGNNERCTIYRFQL